MTPIKLFPNISIDHHQPPQGPTVRTSKILLHMAPLKQLGRREYVDPDFLTELGLTRTDRILSRTMASPGHESESQVVMDQHTLMPLSFYLESYPECFGTSPSPLHSLTFIQLEYITSQRHHCPAETLLWGMGTITFENHTVGELSMTTPLLLPAHTVFTSTGGTMLTVLSEQAMHLTQKPLSPLPPNLHPMVLTESLSTTPLPYSTTLHSLTTPQALSTTTHGCLLFQLQGNTEIHHQGQPIDILYCGEERLLPCSHTPYTLHGFPDPLSVLVEVPC